MSSMKVCDKLAKALKSLVYESDGHYYVGIIGDSCVDDEVKEALSAYQVLVKKS